MGKGGRDRAASPPRRCRGLPGLRPALRGCGPAPGEHAMVRTSTNNKQPGYALHAPPSGQGGAPGGARDTARRFSPCGPAPLVLALRGMLGPFAVCRAHSRPLARPARAPLAALARSLSGCGCRLRGTAAPGNQSPGLLPCLSGAARPAAAGPGGPPRSLAAPARLRLPGGSGPGSLGCPVWLRPCLARPPCVGAVSLGLRACCPRGPRCPGARLPPAGLVPLAAPAGGRGGCGAAVRRPCSASPPPRARRAWGSAAAGKDYGGSLVVDSLVCYDYDGRTTVR